MWIMVLIRHHTKKTRGRPSKPRKPSNILLLQLRDHTASVVAILRTISTISSHPDQCTTSRGISDQMLDEVQHCCCCTCLCHLYLYFSLPIMLVFVHVCIIWTCTVPSASALPILCYPSLSHNPTWPAQTIVILLSHTEGAHQFARNQIVKPHATAFLHNSFLCNFFVVEICNRKMRWKSKWKRQFGCIVGLESWWPVSEWC